MKIKQPQPLPPQPQYASIVSDIVGHGLYYQLLTENSEYWRCLWTYPDDLGHSHLLIEKVFRTVFADVICLASSFNHNARSNLPSFHNSFQSQL